MKILLIIIAIIGMHCGTQKSTDYPKMVIHPTDSGIVWLYKNSERMKIVGPILLSPAPDTSDSTKVDYFPNGIQPKIPPIKRISHRFY